MNYFDLTWMLPLGFAIGVVELLLGQEADLFLFLYY